MARETGVIETDSFVEFFGTGRTMAQCAQRQGYLTRKRRAAIIAVSGGACSLSADQISAYGWEIPEFSPAMVAAINEATKQPGVHNPADIGGAWRNPEKMRQAITTIAKDETIDTILIAMSAGGVFAEGVAKAIVAAAKSITHDVFVSWVGMPESLKDLFDNAGVPAFADFPLAIRAAEACAKFTESQVNQAEAKNLLRVISEAGESATTANSTAGPLWTVAETLADLRRAGLPCAAFDVAAGLDVDDIVSRAEQIGYPIVLKLSSPDLNHKSDDGGVAVRLGDRPSVVAAVEAFKSLAERKRLTKTSVLIQKMSHGVELLVGIKRDPSFGLVLVVGLGGTLAELHAEIAATVLPTTPELLRRLLSQNNRLNMLLDGYRGQPAADREALVSFLADFAAWAQSKGDALQEVDLNPIMVAGPQISIVDGRVMWS